MCSMKSLGIVWDIVDLPVLVHQPNLWLSLLVPAYVGNYVC